MSDELDIENIDSQNDAEVNDNDNEDNDDTPTLEDYQRLAEEKKQLEEKNKKLYARLAKSPTNLRGQAVSPDINDKLDRLELKTEGFSDQEIEFLKPYGGKKALENPFVKAAIDTIREKAKAESAVVDVDSNKSDIEKKYTNDQLMNMPLEELEKILPKS